MRGEEKQERGGRGRVRGSGRVRGMRTRTREQVHVFCPYLCIIPFLLFYLSDCQVSSDSSPPPPVQTGTGLPLNDFSWASPAPDNVGVAAVNNTAGTLFGRSRGSLHRTATAPPAVEWEALMHVEDEVVVLLGGGGCLRPSMRQRYRLAPVPYLVIRCGSVPKVGTVPLLDLNFKLNTSLI